MSYSLLRLSTWLSLVVVSISSHAKLVNVTIDDNDQTITYVPTGEWSLGPTCPSCVAKPDPAQALDGTWHDELFIPANDQTQTMTLSFEGSAIYVYCILAPTSGSLDGNTDMTFFMDGENVNSFTRDTTGQNSYEYNVPVYVNQSVPFGKHTFVLQNGRAGGQAALALFDYVVITTEDDSQNLTSSSATSAGGPTSSPPTAVMSASTSASLQNMNSVQGISTTQGAAASTTTAPQGTTSSSHTRTIAVAVVCSIAGVLLLVGGMLVYRRRRVGTPVYDNEFGGVDPYRLPPTPEDGAQTAAISSTHMQQQGPLVSQTKLVDLDTDLSPPPYE